jgi:hypothetical protein
MIARHTSQQRRPIGVVAMDAGVPLAIHDAGQQPWFFDLVICLTKISESGRCPVFWPPH